MSTSLNRLVSLTLRAAARVENVNRPAVEFHERNVTDTGDDVNLDKGAISRQRKRRPIYGRDVIQPIPCPSLNGLARRRDVTPLGYLVKSLASAASACFLVPRIVSYLMMRLPSSAAPTSNLIRNERLPPGDISVCGRVVQASEPLRYAFVDGLFLPTAGQGPLRTTSRRRNFTSSAITTRAASARSIYYAGV